MIDRRNGAELATHIVHRHFEQRQCARIADRRLRATVDDAWIELPDPRIAVLLKRVARHVIENQWMRARLVRHESKAQFCRSEIVIALTAAPRVRTKSAL